MKLGIVIPAYNEEKRIAHTLEAYSEFFEIVSKKEKIDYEIVVVINNTHDKTEEIVKKYCKKNKKISYLNLPKGGKGYAVIEGFKYCLKKGDSFVGFVDADMSTRPDAFYSLLSNIKGNDGIIASRYVAGAKISPKPTIQRMIVSRLFNALIRVMLLIPYRDTQCGAKLFKREALLKTIPDLTMSKWAFDIDMIYCMKKRGFSIKEQATVWGDKGYSKINFMTAGPWMVLGVIRLRLLNSPFKSFMRIYDKILNNIIKIK